MSEWGTDERIDYVQQQAVAANLDAREVAGVQAYLLGATLTHFDTTPITPMTNSRWRQIVRDAIEAR